MANTKEVVEAIKKVEFMVHVDLFMGPMAEAADIVLPAAHWLELDDIYDMHPRFMIEAHNKVRRTSGRSQIRCLDLQRNRQEGGPQVLVQGCGEPAWTAELRKGDINLEGIQPETWSAAAGARTRSITSTRPITGEKAAASPLLPASSSFIPSAWRSWVMTPCLSS